MKDFLVNFMQNAFCLWNNKLFIKSLRASSNGNVNALHISSHKRFAYSCIGSQNFVLADSEFNSKFINIKLMKVIRTNNYIVSITTYSGQLLIAFTAKNTVILPNFLVWKFCGKAQFPQSFG